MEDRLPIASKVGHSRGMPPSQSLSRRGNYLLLIGVPLLLFGAGLWIYWSSSPAGTYFDSGLSPETYVILDNGRVYLTRAGQNSATDGPLLDTGITYQKIDGNWVIRGPQIKTKSEVFIRNTPFGLQMTCKDNSNPRWNMFYPRKGFVWLDEVGLNGRHAPKDQ